jgi:ABC-2 type transport system permease protein
MNFAMVKLLILKDWYLQRWVILGSLLGCALSLVLMVTISKAMFYVGLLLLITVLISVGAQLAIVAGVNERKEQTLAFVMSLPISYREFTTAKILGNLIVFLFPWTTVFLGCLAVILFLPAVPHGLLPFVTIMCTEILVSTCMVFCVAIMSESQPWTVAAIIIGNIALNIVGYFVAHVPAIAAGMDGAVIGWSNAATAILLSEIALAAALIGSTYFVQSRKPDYI